MFQPVDNRISSDDRARSYEILGFGRGPGTRSIPASVHLPTIMKTDGLLALHARAVEERLHRTSRGALSGLTEYRVGVELLGRASTFDLTEVKRGRPNQPGREA